MMLYCSRRVEKPGALYEDCCRLAVELEICCILSVGCFFFKFMILCPKI